MSITATRTTDLTNLFEKPAQTFLDVGHSRLAHRVVGTGPDLVLIHGWPVNSSTFRHLLPHLVEDFTCHLLDLPGAGESIYSRDTPLSLLHHADAMHRAIDELNLQRYALLGFDSGGLIARYLAAKDNRVTALVLSGTEIPGVHPKLIEMLKLGARVPGFGALLKVLLRSRTFQRSKLGFAGSFHNLELINEDLERHAIAPLLEKPDAMWAALELLRTFTHEMTDGLAEVHPKLTMPVQLIWGEHDPYFPADKAREMASQFPDARFHLIKNGKLFIHEEYPRRYADVATSFLQEATA